MCHCISVICMPIILWSATLYHACTPHAGSEHPKNPRGPSANIGEQGGAHMVPPPPTDKAEAFAHPPDGQCPLIRDSGSETLSATSQISSLSNPCPYNTHVGNERIECQKAFDLLESLESLIPTLSVTSCANIFPRLSALVERVEGKINSDK